MPNNPKQIIFAIVLVTSFLLLIHQPVQAVPGQLRYDTFDSGQTDPSLQDNDPVLCEKRADTLEMSLSQCASDKTSARTLIGILLLLLGLMFPLTVIGWVKVLRPNKNIVLKPQNEQENPSETIA